MGDEASCWAVLASIGLHTLVMALTLGRLPREREALRTDFWPGTTFEVPAHPGALDAPGAEEIAVETFELPGAAAASRTEPPSNVPDSSRDGSPQAHEPRRTTATTRPGELAKAQKPQGASAKTGSNAQAGSFGAEATAPGVRDLLRSFVRATPIVASSDPVWGTLPLGAAGKADLTLGIDENGRPHLKAPFEGTVPPHLARLVQKTLLVMASGRFAPTGEPVASEQRIHIALSITQEARPAPELNATGGVFGLRFEPPDEHQVSRAFFTLVSGRRVEVSVRPLPVR